MLSLRVSRDKRGYDHIYLLLESRRKGRTVTRLLYGGRWPAPLRIGQPPLDEATRHRLEQAYPDVTFDWVTLQKTLQQALSIPRVAPPPGPGRPRRPGAPPSGPGGAMSAPSRSGGRGAPPQRPQVERRPPESPFRTPAYGSPLESVDLDEPILASMAGLEQTAGARLEVVEQTFIVHTSGPDDLRVEMDTVVVVAEIADDRDPDPVAIDPDVMEQDLIAGDAAAEAFEGSYGSDIYADPGDASRGAGRARQVDTETADDDEEPAAGAAGTAEDEAAGAAAGGLSPAARRRRRRRRRGTRRPDGTGQEQGADAPADGPADGAPEGDPRPGGAMSAGEHGEAGPDSGVRDSFDGARDAGRDDDRDRERDPSVS